MKIRVKDRKRFSKFLSVICAVSVMISILFLINIASAELNVKHKEVVAMPGDTLWAIASQNMPDRDTRSAVETIKRYNNKTSSELYSGDIILIPIK